MTDVDESEAVESLQRLGLSKYEAQVFVALERVGRGTARDVDRMTDVPRSQVYGAAENLEERGLVEVQQSNPIEYRAVPLDEASEILRDRFETEQERAFDYLERARERRDHADEHKEGVWTVHGQENVSARIQQIVDDAEERVLYVTCAELFDDEIAATVRDRATDVDVWVFSADHAVLEAFAANDDVGVGPFEDESGDQVGGRLLAVDGSAVLLSVMAGEELPGVHAESAIWSAETGIAGVLLELLRSHLDEEIGDKL